LPEETLVSVQGSTFASGGVSAEISVDISGAVDVFSAASDLLDAVPDAILVVSPTLTITYLNNAARIAFGNGSGETDDFAGVSGIDLIHPDDRERILGELVTILDRPAASVTVEFRVHDYEAGSGWKPTQAMASNRIDHPSIGGIVVSFRDLRREEHFASSVHRLGEALERTSDLMILHDRSGMPLHVNAAGRHFLGDAVAEAQTWPYPPKLTHLLVSRAIPHAMKHGDWNGDIQLVDQTGEVRTLSVVITMDEQQCTVITARDITDQKRAEETLRHRAAHDTLTGLPNRSALIDHLSELTNPKKQRRVAVLFIDLDRFKLVNDSLGHHFGDELLIEVANRFRSAIGSADLLARLGGDEFVAVLNDALGTLPMDQVARAVADRLHQSMKLPVPLGGTMVYLGASIGISMQDGSASASDLLRQADLAMFRAKATGRARTEQFVASMAIDVQRGLTIETELHAALDANELFVAYQPILDMHQQLHGFEALIRWQRGDEVVEPAGFLAVAQESSLILQIDEMVLRRACLQLAEWSLMIPGNRLQMSVNLSARQLARPDIYEVVKSAIEDSGIEPSALSLEITEGNLMTDLRATVAALDRLRTLGVQLSIDDFGVGYSSFTYLQRFGAHTVKIDRSFVEFAPTDEGDSRIVSAIVGLAQTFGMSTIAEGIETVEQFERVRALGCDAAQGFLIGRAVNAERAGAYVEAAKSPEAMAALLATAANVQMILNQNSTRT
jgi:diguanylate cyclase (GGDEF)-like protein